MKTKSAKYAKMQRGEYQSKICPYGYRKSADGRMEPTRKLLGRWYSSFSSLRQPALGRQPLPGNYLSEGIPTPGEYKATHGQQYHDVSRSRGRWSSSTVLRILEDERYIGSYVMDGGQSLKWEVHGAA